MLSLTAFGREIMLVVGGCWLLCMTPVVVIAVRAWRSGPETKDEKGRQE